MTEESVTLEQENILGEYHSKVTFISFFFVQNDLRDKSAALTNQMWLLYITFEDFICLSYPGQSETILSTRLDINNYLKTHNITTKRDKYKNLPCDNSDKATKETCPISTSIRHIKTSRVDND
jgi:hypothetical protein